MDGPNIISTAIVQSEHCLQSLIICLLVSFESYVIFLIIFVFLYVMNIRILSGKRP